MGDKNGVFNVLTVIKSNYPAASQRRWSSARGCAEEAFKSNRDQPDN